MPETTEGTTGVIPESTEGATGATSTTGETPKTIEAVLAELEKAKAALKAANSESASRRKRLEELEKAEQERAQAQLSETEKLKAQLAEMAGNAEKVAAELQATRIRSAVLTKAGELGFVSPEDAAALADMSAVQIDDDGKVTGFEKALEALAKSGRLPMRNAAAQTPGTPRKTTPAMGVTPAPAPAPVRIRT